MSTRRAGDLRFDHGAQYFTARDPRFESLVASWLEDGLVAPWDGRIAVVDRGTVTIQDGRTQRFVGVPGMNAVCRRPGDRTRVRFERERRLSAADLAARRRAARIGLFDAVVVSAPAPQTVSELLKAVPELAKRAAEVEMAPCWAAMAGFDEPLGSASTALSSRRRR